MLKLRIMVFVTTTIVAILTSCMIDSGRPPTPTPTPTPMPVKLCYDFFQKERESNPSRLDARRGTDFRCKGQISEISGASIQFHIKVKPFEQDQYLDCESPKKESVEHLNVGDWVVFKGTLDEAFPNLVPLVQHFGQSGAVKFEDCSWERSPSD